MALVHPGLSQHRVGQPGRCALLLLTVVFRTRRCFAAVAGLCCHGDLGRPAAAPDQQVQCDPGHDQHGLRRHCVLPGADRPHAALLDHGVQVLPEHFRGPGVAHGARHHDGQPYRP